MKVGKKLTAPLSAVFLIIVAGLAFTHLQPRTEQPPVIFDPQFDLWVSDSDLGGTRPLVWELEYVKGIGDRVRLHQTVLADRKALEIQILQDGADDRWAYVYLRQTIDGARLRALFADELGMWTFSQRTCGCGGSSPPQSTVFGLEINDGLHTLTFIFSPEAAEPQQFLSHRTVFLHTSPGTWVYQRIDVEKEYDDAHWNHPDRLLFSIVLGAPGLAAGTHVGYVSEFSWTRKTTVTSAEQESPRPRLLSSVWFDMPCTVDRRTNANALTCTLRQAINPPRGSESVTRV